MGRTYEEDIYYIDCSGVALSWLLPHLTDCPVHTLLFGIAHTISNRRVGTDNEINIYLPWDRTGYVHGNTVLTVAITVLADSDVWLYVCNWLHFKGLWGPWTAALLSSNLSHHKGLTCSLDLKENVKKLVMKFEHISIDNWAIFRLKRLF